MPTIDKSVDETFTYVETVGKSLPPPTSYTSIRTNLVEYRKKVMSGLVSARVKASILANSQALAKYRDRLAGLSTTAYMFDALRRHALTLNFKGMDIGTGIIRGAMGEFVSPVSLYPMKPPYQVPQRNLPTVDVFTFTPFTDMETSEQSQLEQLKTLACAQSDKTTFKDNPNAENSNYRFFYMYPQCKVKGKWTFLNPYSQYYEAWRGEYVLLSRELRTANDYIAYIYDVLIWIDSDVEQPKNTAQPRWYEAIMSWNQTERREDNVFYYDGGAPVIPLNITGKTVKSDDRHLYHVYPTTGFIMGNSWMSDSFTVDETERVWLNAWKITVSVNDPVKGTTDPVPDTYTKKALSDGAFWLTALPNPTYTFDHWEIDGISIGNHNPYYVYPLKDSEIKAFFV